MISPSILHRHRVQVMGDLSPLQLQVDGLVGSFVREASNPITLISLTAGGMAYRIGRIGGLGIDVGAIGRSPIRVASVVSGLVCEVTAFEFASRTLNTFWATGQSPLQMNLSNQWSLSGPGGWQEGLLTSLIAFGTLRGAGFLAREQNLILQHTLQSSAMVTGHNLSGRLGLTPRPTGNLAEQFLHAEATNLQLGAGMGLVHAMAPGLHEVERGLDLSLSSRTSPFRSLGWRPSLLQHAAAGPLKGSAPHIVLMAGETGNGGGRPPGPVVPDLYRRSQILRRLPEEFFRQNPYEIVAGLDALREGLREEQGLTEPPKLHLLLTVLMSHGKITREKREGLQWAISARELFLNSALLQSTTEITPDDLFRPEALCRRLLELRPAIETEQGRTGYSLGTLVQALVFGGRVPYSKQQRYVKALASVDLYDRSKTLQDAGEDLNWEDPVAFARQLRGLRPQVQREQGQRYALTTLVEAIAMGDGRLPKKRLPTFLYTAGASDFVERLHEVQGRIDFFSSLPRDLFLVELLRLKSLVKNSLGENPGIGYLLLGFRVQGLETVKDGVVDDTTLHYANSLDKAFQRWEDWGPHFRNLGLIPKKGLLQGWSRIDYGREHLKQNNGRPYATSSLSALIRWGIFLYQNRELLKLSAPREMTLRPREDNTLE